ncbi:MAG: hypothetical protein ILA02_07240 [Clostridia bacterium]|nr:hypothetical protein [Clostridia bacterium]
MQTKKKVSTIDSNMKEKIEYLRLNFEKVPKTLIATDNLNFKLFKGYDEKQYKQYKYIKISDIDILLTPTHRLDSLSERYDKASPLYMYLDSKQEENAEKYITFLKMLKKIEISDVEKIEKEQEKLAKEIPFKVKYNGNYLWQIYYSESTDRYFMLVPTEDSDYSAFFYLLKKKIENKRNEKVFVPISYLDYSEDILKKSEIKDLENYLWLFTKDYPSIYEVFDQNNKNTLQIIGETKVYGRIRTLYKMVFDSSKEANKFFKLLKALFILQIGLPHYYNFTTSINENGEIELYLDNEKIKYEELPKFVSNQYKKSVELKISTEKEIITLNEKLNTLKKESIQLEKEYLEKEKMISTFLECKKSFFGKVKYFFTSGKKSKKTKKNDEKISVEDKLENNENSIDKNIEIEEKNHTLDELIMSFKELELVENKKKNAVQDINALKLKNKNLKKKIENASSYINEINKHKKSIFEFWKYSNKDQVASLEEGEQEEVNISKIEKVFDYDNDFEIFGEKVDKNQRLKFTDSELEASYIASTDLFDLVKRIHNKENIELTEYSEVLKELKDQKTEVADESDETFDVFGSDSAKFDKERKIGNKTHRENPRNKYQILGIKKGMKVLELKKALTDVDKELKKALTKNSLNEDLYVYFISENKIDIKGLMIVSLNEEKYMQDFIKYSESNSDIYIYRIKLPINTNFIGFTNIVMYNNRNMTLPVGMHESSQILIDYDKLNINQINNNQINIEYLENEKDDFSNIITRKINVLEFEANNK